MAQTLRVSAARLLFNSVLGAIAAQFLLAASVDPALARVSSGGPTSISFARYANYAWLLVRVNGSGPFQFVLDSGASACIINQKTADLLKLRVAGEHHESNFGTGENSSTIGFAENVTLSLSGVDIQPKHVAVASLLGLEQALGHRIDGILGPEVFRRYVVEINYAEGTMVLHEPRAYRYSGPGQILPIELKDGRAFIRATINLDGVSPIDGLFAVDSGANGALTLHTPFVQRHQLLSPERKTIEHLVYGVAGQAPERLTRAHSFHLGAFSIQNPVVALSTANKGSSADSSYDGVIGGEVLRRFKVVFMEQKRKIILEANHDFDQPFSTDTSGASLRADGPNFSRILVEKVLDGSPASEAGLRVGDEITTIEGHQVTDYTLEQLRQMFKREAVECQVGIRRNNEMLLLRINLRKLL